MIFGVDSLCYSSKPQTAYLSISGSFCILPFTTTLEISLLLGRWTFPAVLCEFSTSKSKVRETVQWTQPPESQISSREIKYLTEDYRPHCDSLYLLTIAPIFVRQILNILGRGWKAGAMWEEEHWTRWKTSIFNLAENHFLSSFHPTSCLKRMAQCSEFRWDQRQWWCYQDMTQWRKLWWTMQMHLQGDLKYKSSKKQEKEKVSAVFCSLHTCLLQRKITGRGFLHERGMQNLSFFFAKCMKQFEWYVVISIKDNKRWYP